ncbi:hypothetical protein Ciccas_004907 [Cichlidogyrus casuarinus]|uniref:3CxxC-type domain-containing protein n=1 Tax=Cichlidogyrus casuarinus TaxID=1844966 RepID=A0ABD2QA61_9PLAT
MYWCLRPGANVFFELYPQLCQTCGQECLPKWYPEEIKRVLNNFFVKIHNIYYNAAFVWEDELNHIRRFGNPNGPHDRLHCIACFQGTCQSVKSRTNDQPDYKISLAQSMNSFYNLEAKAIPQSQYDIIDCSTMIDN